MNKIIIRPKPYDQTKGQLIIGQQTFPCALGRSGITSQKREGDGATPRFSCKPLYGFYRPDKGPKPVSKLPFIPLHPSMGWCDMAGHANYNRAVKLPFAPSHETMWRADELYDIGAVLDINITERKQGMGSAIFFHIARPMLTPTEGCVAVRPKVMLQILPQISRHTIFELYG